MNESLVVTVTSILVSSITLMASVLWQGRWKIGSSKTNFSNYYIHEAGEQGGIEGGYLRSFSLLKF